MDVDSDNNDLIDYNNHIQTLINDSNGANLNNISKYNGSVISNVNSINSSDKNNNPTNDDHFDYDKLLIKSIKIDRGIRSNNYTITRDIHYDEWMQKTISWIAMNLGFIKMDVSAIELLCSYAIKLIQHFGRRAQTLAKIRSSESANYIDMKSVLQNSFPNFYTKIYSQAKFLSIKPFPIKINSGNYHLKSQPAYLPNPSFLYYECLLSAGVSITNANSIALKQNSDKNNYSVPINIANYIDDNINPQQNQDSIIDNNNNSSDGGSIGIYVAGGYSANDEPLYQKLVMSRRKFCHKHFPILPLECFRDTKGHSLDNCYSYMPNAVNKSQAIDKQKIILQSELPLLQ